MIYLDQHERDKFAAYLEQDSESDSSMIEQLIKVGMAPEQLIKKMKAEAVASRIVALKLRSIETETIGE